MDFTHTTCVSILHLPGAFLSVNMSTAVSAATSSLPNQHAPDTPLLAIPFTRSEFAMLSSICLELTTFTRHQQRLSRLRNDLYCVEWGVKLYSLTHSDDLRTPKAENLLVSFIV